MRASRRISLAAGVDRHGPRHLVRELRVRHVAALWRRPRLRASVVERSAGAASLHAVAGGGGHVALLVKANDKRLKVDVKASDQGLVDTVVAELKGLAV